MVVMGVFVGTYLWWGGLTVAVALVRKSKKADCFRKMDRVFGAVLSLFGIVVSSAMLMQVMTLVQQTVLYKVPSMHGGEAWQISLVEIDRVND